MKKKLLAAAMAVILLAVVLCPWAAAKEWTGEDYAFTIPEEFVYILNRGTAERDPVWALAGVADPAARLEDYADMSVIADLYTEDGKTNVVVIQKETTVTQDIYNLKNLNEEEKAKFLEQLIQAQSDEVTLDKRFLEFGGQPFYRVELNASSGEQEAHELLYGTIFNGHTLNFQIYNSRPFTEKERELIESAAGSVRITLILEKTEPDPVSVVPILIILAMILLVLLAPAVYIPVKKSREKKRKAMLAERLSQFHQTHGSSGHVGELLFENHTECSKELIHRFSTYHAYIKNLPAVLIGAVICVLMLAAAFLMNMTWWIKILAVGITAYYGFQLFNMPSNVEKVQQKVLGRGMSSTAHYGFYEDAFRVSGIQYASLVPYFEITEIRRQGQVLYLYYSEDNAYPVDKTGFTKGEAADFEAFLAGKLKS